MQLCGRLKVAHNVCICLHSYDEIFDVHHNTHGKDASVLVCKCARMFHGEETEHETEHASASQI